MTPSMTSATSVQWDQPILLQLRVAVPQVKMFLELSWAGQRQGDFLSLSHPQDSQSCTTCRLMPGDIPSCAQSSFMSIPRGRVSAVQDTPSKPEVEFSSFIFINNLDLKKTYIHTFSLPCSRGWPCRLWSNKLETNLYFSNKKSITSLCTALGLPHLLGILPPRG